MVPILIVGVFGMTTGITYPVITLVLESHGVSAGVAGMNGAMTPLGMLIGALAIAGLTRRLGPWMLMLIATGLTVGLLGALTVWYSLPAWFVLRFAIGFCTVAMFVLSETWISTSATNVNRGRLLTAYTSVLALGFTIGPAVLAASGDDYIIPLALATACPAVALLALAPTRSLVPELGGGGDIPVRELATVLSSLLIPLIAVAVFDSVTLQFLPSFGLGSGLPIDSAAVGLMVMLIGQVIFQFPMGWLADRIGAVRALILSLTLGIAGALALPITVSTPAYWPLLALWGGAAFAGYPLILTILGESMSTTTLLLGNIAFAVVWGIGGIIGPPFTGAAIDLFGANGMPWSLAALWAVALIVLLWRRSRNAQSSPRAG